MGQIKKGLIKFSLSMVIVICLAFIFIPHSVFATDNNSDVGNSIAEENRMEQEDNSSEDDSEEAVKNGIIEENGKLYYYTNGVLYKEGWLYLKQYNNYVYADKEDGHFYMGVQTINDGEDKDGTYFFDPDNKGLRFRGIKTIDGKNYYYDWNTYKLVKNGWLYFNGYNHSWVYTDRTTGEFATGKKTIAGDDYLFDENGYCKRGLIEENSDKYYYDWNTYKLRKNQMIYFGGYNQRWACPDDTGKFRSGRVDLAGVTRYFDDNGFSVRGLLVFDGDKYYYDWNTYALRKNEMIYFGGYNQRWACPDWNGKFRSGEVEINGVNRYFDKDGFSIRGILTFNGKKYYYDWNTYKLRRKAMIYFGGYNQRWAFADKYTGEFLTGRVNYNGVIRYFDKEGFSVRGVIYSEDHYFYYDWNTYKLYKGGWLYLNPYDEWVYASPRSGAFYTGYRNIYGSTYQFNKYGYHVGGAMRPISWFDTRGVHSKTNYLIMVDRDGFRVKVYRGGKGNWSLVKSSICGVGRLDLPTPKGAFEVGYKWYHFGEEEGYTCYYYTHFYGGRYEDLGFHSILYYPYSYRFLQAGYGQYISHGCIRLPYDQAQWIYYNVPKGTRVLIF